MNKTASTYFRSFFDSENSKWLNDWNFKNNGPTKIEQFSDKVLYRYCKFVGFNARIWSRRFIATLPEVAKRRLYKKYGYGSIHEFAAKLAGISHHNVDEVLRVDEKFKELPMMKALIGEVGLSKLKVVVCIATKDTDGFWAEKVKNMTKSSLEIYVRELKRKENAIGENKIESTIFQPLFLQILPGEASVERGIIPQGQGQIGIFDSEKSISYNGNDARVANQQKRYKKTFTIQIDDETEFELRKFKQMIEKERKEPIDWNLTLKEILKKVNRSEKYTTEKALKTTRKEKNVPKQQIVERKTLVQITKEVDMGPTPVSRYIPAKIKHDLKVKYNGHCAYRGCNKPAEQIHHNDRFAIKRSHENVVPLCKSHHDFVHQAAAKQRTKDRDFADQTPDKIFNKFKNESFAAKGV